MWLLSVKVISVPEKRLQLFLVPQSGFLKGATKVKIVSDKVTGAGKSGL